MRVFCGFHRPIPVARVAQACSMRRPAALQSSFQGRSLLPLKLSVPGFAAAGVAQDQRAPVRRSVLVEAHGNSKRSLGDTKHGTRRHRTRTSGFRARKQTVGGKRVLAARRKKGRKTLCPANSRTGVKSSAASDRR